MHKLFARWAFILLALGMLLPLQAYAQSAGRATLSPPQVIEFPAVTTQLKAFDTNGNFLQGLRASDVRILENEREVPIKDIQLVRPGVQFVLALNPGPSFAIRDIHGVSRLDEIVTALIAWAAELPATISDDISLVSTTGPRLTHQRDARQIAEALANYQPDARNLNISFDLLREAIDLAADPSPRAGMGRVVLFVTPPPDRDTGVSLQNLASLAIQQDVRVFVWMVASVAMFDAPGVEQLELLATQTGGRIFKFSGEETFPSIEAGLEPLRYLYEIEYESQIRASGEYQVYAEVQVDGEITTTEPRLVGINISKPNPVFMAPPTVIERAVPEESNADSSPLLPTIQRLQVLIEFPDGNHRELVRSALYVNGEVEQVNNQPPFDSFTWDLSDFNDNAEHILFVEVEDSLGLLGRSIDTPIDIVIKGRPTGVALILVERAPTIAALAALLAGAVLLWALIVGGRIKPRTPAMLKWSHRNKDLDPLTQPVKARIEPKRSKSLRVNVSMGRVTGSLAAWATRLPWSHRRGMPHPYAYLERLDERDQVVSATAMPLTSKEVIFGKDPAKANFTLEDPSVNAAHARLVQEKDGRFRIYDLDSIAGTWVNYSPVTPEGVYLEQGDLLHFGKSGFRFILADAERGRKLIVHVEDQLP
jgi:hypothetical protein